MRHMIAGRAHRGGWHVLRLGVTGRPAALCAAFLCIARAGAAAAQVVPGDGVDIGSLAADRARVRQITGRPVDSATAAPRLPGLHAIAPTVRVTWNSDLPFGGNDGELWAGRGANASVTGGFGYTHVRAERRLDLIVAPTISYSGNRPIVVLPGREPGRSAFSSPWHYGQASADLPLRFGDLPVRTLGLGQSSLTVTSGRLAYGASSTNEWWGPAIRNTLLLSRNAAGVPRLFLRAARPVRTRFGEVDGRTFIGALTESPFFDSDPGNDTRSLSGVLLTYRPALDTGLTLGFSRLVMAPVPSRPAILLHVADVALRYETVSQSGDTMTNGRTRQGSDQLFSFFARWVFPESGFETYGEWARAELPSSIRESLEAPQSTQAYTLGLQWANPKPTGGYVRLQGEISYLEQTQVLADRPVRDYYVGRAAVQGFTQRGQVLGAAIGPGSSTQFLGADWIAPAWQMGAFVGRTRTENDALYRQVGANAIQHDVTIFSGVRGGVRLLRQDVSGELTVGRRLNYLFQNDGFLDAPKAADIQNVTFTLLLSPR